MGNSLRGYFGNLCGAEESKRAFTDSSDEKQPKEQPKTEELLDGTNKEKGDKVDGQTKADPSNAVEDEDALEILEEDEADKAQESLSRVPSIKKTLLHVFMSFTTPKFESFGIGQLDQKFENAHTTTANFVEFLHIFRGAIHDFTKLFKKKEFEQAWHVYSAFSGKEGKGIENDSKAKVTEDIAKGSGLIKKGREQYPIVRKKITDTKEKLNVAAKDVETLCIKDYVRDEMADKSYISKASVPGKYRRNAKSIRKKIRALEEAEAELEEWYRLTAMDAPVDAPILKPDLLDDVKELNESPGIARRKQSTGDRADVEKKDEGGQEHDVVTITVTEISLEDAKLSEVEVQDESGAQEVVLLEDEVISDMIKSETPEKVEENAESNDKVVIVEDICVSEVKVAEELVPFSAKAMGKEATVKDSENESEAAVIVESEKEAQEAKEQNEETKKTTPTESDRATSPPPVDTKDKATKKKKKEEKKANTQETKDKGKSQEIKDEGKKTPVAVPAVETKTVTLVVSVEPSAAVVSTPAGGSSQKGVCSSVAVNSSEAVSPPVREEAPCEPDVVESPDTPDKSFRSEENDEVGVLPVVPGSSKLERKISSASADLEEGKLTDYGSYLVLTDDQDLLRRSRSLDSLTSRGSRQSISRLGSFEMVTNFELTMAEQAESERRKMLSNSQKSL